MDTKDFRGVALNPYYEFSVEVPLSNYGVRFEDYQKAFQAGFRRAHRYWDGIEDVTVVSETPTLLVRRLHFGGGASATKGRESASRTGFSTPKARCTDETKSRSSETGRTPA